MSAIEIPTQAIDFSEKVYKEQPYFDYSSNPLYNLSATLFAHLLSLSRLPKPDNLSLFKGLLKQQIIQLSDKGKELDYPAAVVDKLCCLHCIVLDEFIIHSLWGEDAGWENNTLLSELFGLKNGGDLFFTITDKALRQANKMGNLLEIIYVFLQIGFKGRYRSRETEQLGVIIKTVKAAIADKITPAQVTNQDSPVVKSQYLFNGARYISFTVIIVVMLTVVIAFFDYWFKETYELRSVPLTQLKDETAKHILNAQSKDIIYISTDEDIHSVTRLSSSKSARAASNDKVLKPVKEVAINTESLPNESLITDKKIETTETKSAYRLQLASFSSKSNARNYVTAFQQSRFPVEITEVGQYFVVYSSAKNERDMQTQKAYFKDTFQVTVIVKTITVLR